MSTIFICANFSDTTRDPGIRGKVPKIFLQEGVWLLPGFQGGGSRTLPLRVETHTPLYRLRTQTVNLCALFLCLTEKKSWLKGGADNL